jgi:hypothetical protein
MSLRNACLLPLTVTVLAFAATGPLTVPIKEYEVPTPKSRPHDPARSGTPGRPPGAPGFATFETWDSTYLSLVAFR